MKKYKLNDGNSYDVYEAQALMEKTWKEPVSISLMQQRLSYSNDSKYVFMQKGQCIKGGHPYSNDNQKRKRAKANTKDVDTEARKTYKPKPEPKLSAKNKAMKAAFIAAGLSYGVNNGYIT